MFNLYLIRGGFRFHTITIFQNRMQYIFDIFDSIVLKDISSRHQIRDIAQLRKILLFYIANVGNPISAISISNYLKNEKRGISTETLYNYVEYGKESCLLNPVNREDLIGKSILKTQSKIYITDHRLRNAVHQNNRRDINQTLENIVYVEHLRRGYDVTVGKVKDAEIDFCAKKNGETGYFQVAYLLATPKTAEREFSALEKVNANFPKYILSMDEILQSRNGIIHKNVVDFLMEKTV